MLEFIEHSFSWQVFGCHDQVIGKIERNSVVGVMFEQSSYYPYGIELEEMEQILTKMKELQGEKV